MKAFADTMVKDHTMANEDLAVVARNHNINFPPAMPAKAKATYDKMAKLTGAAFDKAYVKDMVEDHTMDVAAYKKAMGEVKDEKLKEYVNKVGPIVEHHLQMIKDIQTKMGGKTS